MKRVPVTTEQHRKAKARAAEMGLTLERYIDILIEDASRRPAEEILRVVMDPLRDRESVSNLG